MTALTPDVLEDLEKLLAKAMQEPWLSHHGPQGGYVIETEPSGMSVCQRSAWPGRAVESMANGTLIATLRNHAAALIAAARERDRLLAEDATAQVDSVTLGLVLHALGIEDSDIDPVHYVENLLDEIEQLRDVARAAQRFVREGTKLTEPRGIAQVVIEKADKSDPQCKLFAALKAAFPDDPYGQRAALNREPQP